MSTTWYKTTIRKKLIILSVKHDKHIMILILNFYPYIVNIHTKYIYTIDDTNICPYSV